MPQIQKVFLSAVAVAATLGAVQLAFGHDLADRWQAVADKPGHVATGNVVNRSGKADRLAETKSVANPTRTVSMRLNDLADTSVLLRVPAAVETGNARPPMLLQKSGRKPTVACEPMVSSLTEVAKLLQPGRCVT
ncbi:hypothetical protein [Bradyrhizobium sp.]|uniref:hypothetical protein n=1 Tax=Bradyrhizobium sp. TaxID=376 RepID=UPI0039E41ED8